MTMKFLTILVGSAALLAACEVDVKEEGRLPDVDVDVSADAGEMPEIEVRGPDVEVGTKDVEVAVPDVDVDVDTEKKTVSVPDIDVEMPKDES